jgi:hypothetical protein
MMLTMRATGMPFSFHQAGSDESGSKILVDNENNAFDETLGWLSRIRIQKF